MIAAALTCPPAPFLIPGLAPELLTVARDSYDAILRGLSQLARAEQVVVLAGGAPAVFAPGTVVDDAGLTRHDHPLLDPTALPGGPAQQHLRHGSVGTVVAAHLLTAAGISTPTWVIQGDADPGELLAQADTAVLVMADGCGSIGEDAPGGFDERAAGFEGQLRGALAGGSAARLAQTVEALAPFAPGLRAGSWPVWQRWSSLIRNAENAATELVYYGAPFGVGYSVYLWQWNTPLPAKA